MKNGKHKIIVPSGMVAWVDCDEVIVKFQKLFHEHLRKHYKLKIPANFVSKEWDYSSVLPKSITIDDAMRTLPENWTEIQELHEGAKEFMLALKNMGCRVVIITHVNEELAPGRVQNLINHGIYFDEIYFTLKHKKIDFAKKLIKRYQDEDGKPVRNFFVDDRAKNVIEFIQELPNFVQGITLDTPYNDLEKKQYGHYMNIDFTSKDQKEMFAMTLKSIKNRIKDEKSTKRKKPTSKKKTRS
jgi:FMN phosphatase YigB (HAD superfamily)